MRALRTMIYRCLEAFRPAPEKAGLNSDDARRACTPNLIYARSNPLYGNGSCIGSWLEF